MYGKATSIGTRPDAAVTTAADRGRAEFAAADEGVALRLLMLGSSATSHEGVQCDKNVSQV